MLYFGMTYSKDLRERVVKYVRDGGEQLEAVRLFGISRKTVYHWLHRNNISSTPVRTRVRKLNKALLAAHVEKYPDALLRERAEHFGVHINAIWFALRRMNIRKKNDTVRGKKPQ